MSCALILSRRDDCQVLHMGRFESGAEPDGSCFNAEKNFSDCGSAARPNTEDLKALKGMMPGAQKGPLLLSRP